MDCFKMCIIVEKLNWQILIYLVDIYNYIDLGLFIIYTKICDQIVSVILVLYGLFKINRKANIFVFQSYFIRCSGSRHPTWCYYKFVNIYLTSALFIYLFENNKKLRVWKLMWYTLMLIWQQRSLQSHSCCKVTNERHLQNKTNFAVFPSEKINQNA